MSSLAYVWPIDVAWSSSQSVNDNPPKRWVVGDEQAGGQALISCAVSTTSPSTSPSARAATAISRGGIRRIGAWLPGRMLDVRDEIPEGQRLRSGRVGDHVAAASAASMQMRARSSIWTGWTG